MSESSMPSIKRTHDGSEKEKEANLSPFMPMFETFRDELDEHHDRRERVIKTSRDITAASKKIIFALQRVRTLKSDIPEKIAKEVDDRASAMQKQMEAIAPDLAGINAWRYQRQISGGIQEYIEAIAFQHYIQFQTLITPTESSALLPSRINLTPDDYLLGLFDLSGELMRYAITTIATTGGLPKSGDRDILVDLRSVRACFEALDTTSSAGTGLGKDVQKKMEVMQQSVDKVETAVYGLIIRGRERPKGWVPDLKEERVVESY